MRPRQHYNSTGPHAVFTVIEEPKGGLTWLLKYLNIYVKTEHIAAGLKRDSITRNSGVGVFVRPPVTNILGSSSLLYMDKIIHNQMSKSIVETIY